MSKRLSDEITVLVNSREWGNHAEREERRTLEQAARILASYGETCIVDTVNPDELPDEVLSSVMQNLGWNDEDDEAQDEYIAKVRELTPDEAFARYCDWHGLIGWSTQLANALDSIRRAAR